MLFVPVPSGFSRTEFKCPYIIIYTYYIYLIYLYFYFLTFSSVILWWLFLFGHFVSNFTPPIIFFLHRIGQNMYWSILFSFYHKCIGGKTMWVSVSCVNLWISLVTVVLFVNIYIGYLFLLILCVTVWMFLERSVLRSDAFSVSVLSSIQSAFTTQRSADSHRLTWRSICNSSGAQFKLKNSLYETFYGWKVFSQKKTLEDHCWVQSQSDARSLTMMLCVQESHVMKTVLLMDFLFILCINEIEVKFVHSTVNM